MLLWRRLRGGAGRGATSFILGEENGNKSGKRKAVWLSGRQQPQLRKMERTELVSGSKKGGIELATGGIDHWVVFLTRSSGSLF